MAWTIRNIMSQKNRRRKRTRSADAKVRRSFQRKLQLEALEDRRLLAGAGLEQFDFGTTRSPVEAGYTRVANNTRYSAASGFGWVSGSISAADRRTGSDSDRDFNFTRNGTFAADVPDGAYEVDVVLGDLGRYRHDNVGVFLEEVQVDDVTTAPRELARRTYQTTVNDGQLTLRLTDLGGRDMNAVIESLVIRSSQPTLDIGDASVTEGDNGSQTLTFPVTLSRTSSDTVTAQYATNDSSATIADGDYLPATGTVTIAPGQTSAQVSVTVLGDVDPELDEQLHVTLSSASNAQIGNQLGTGSILNDDEFKSFELSAAPATFSEADGNSASTITITRTGDLSSSVTASISDDSGGLITTATSVFFGIGQAQQTFDIDAVDNGAYDGEQVVTIGAAAAGYLGNSTQVTVTDDDTPPINLRFDFGRGNSPVGTGYTRVANTTRYSAGLGHGWSAGTIRGVDRRTGSAVERDFNYTREGTFVADVPNGRYSVAVTLGDLGRRAHDNVGVYLENSQVDVVSTAAREVVTRTYEVGVTDGQLTLMLDDLGGRDGIAAIEALMVTALGPPLPELSIADRDITEGDSGSQQLVFDVNLSTASADTVTVMYATANDQAIAGGDYFPGSGTLTFLPGETLQQVSVTVNGDEVVEGDEAFFVNLTNPSEAVIADGQAVGAILNDDIAKVLTVSIASGSIPERNGAATGTVTRTGDTSASLTVGLGGSDDLEASTVSSVTIQPGQTSATFAIQAHDDPDSDGNQTVTFTATAPQFASGSASVEVVDDEIPPYAGFFDFGRANSPVATGYVQVSEATTYNANRGYGWVAGTPRSVVRRTSGALDRDIVYSRDITFEADVPDGTYKVDLLLGDRSYAHDQIGVYVEGQLRDVVDTPARQLVSLEVIATVSDGKLTVRLEDMGGRDAYVTIAAMRVIPVGANLSDYDQFWPVRDGIEGVFSEAYNRNGFIYYDVDSPYQSSTNNIRVLLPSDYSEDQLYQVIYVLPVELGNRTQFGDGLTTVRNGNLADLHDVIFVAPSFSLTPWYVDHVSRQDIWQETFFREVVIPFVEQEFSVSGNAEDRLLLGFSKSGYGALSMMLRHPDDFGRAVVWDGPIGMSNPNEGWDFVKMLGSRQNFTRNYEITRLLPLAADDFRNGPVRIFLMGWGHNLTRVDHATIDQMMTDLGIPHFYQEGVRRSHVWASGWVPEVVSALMS